MKRVLALNSAGTPLDLISYEKAAFYAAKDLISWSLGDRYTLHGGIQRSTGIQSTLDIDNIIAIKGKAHGRRKVPRLTNRTLFKRDMNLCAYCGNQYQASYLTRDHIIPRVQNGKDVWINVVTSCSPCNKHKGGRTPEQSHMKLLYVPYTPCINEFLILKYRTILYDQMEFLLKNIKTKNTRIHEIIRGLE